VTVDFPSAKGVQLTARVPKRLRPLLVALLLTSLVGISACGSDSEDKASGGGGAKPVEMAFLTSMVHHHETAIEMADIAKKRGQSPFVKGLAGNIVATQENEMEQMRSIYQRLFNAKLEPDPMGHDGLGLTAEEAGMTHSPATNATLLGADPFDRAFVDEMEPHHTGAVKMAEVVLESTEDAELRKLAEGIVSTQEREIEEMNSFREQKYGAPVPSPSGEDGGEHGGGHSG